LYGKNYFCRIFRNNFVNVLIPFIGTKEADVNDQAVWEQAVAAAGRNYASLSKDVAAQLAALIEDIMRLKHDLVELAISAGSMDICRTCGGECCRYGKYHLSVLDIMACLKSGTDIVTPDFSSNMACPYSNASGCTMTPGYRPMTCVVFNCQLLDEKFTSAQRETFLKNEQDLREAISRTGHITGMRLDRALLLSCS
jgi:hypothetical protein